MKERHYKVDDFRHLLGEECELIGNTDNTISNVKPISNADVQSLTWFKLNNNDGSSTLSQTNASIIICHFDQKVDNVSNKLIVKTKDPKLLFIRIVSELFNKEHLSGIHPSAIIDEKSKIGKNVFIGPNTVINDSSIGDNTQIFGNCFIFSGTIIGQHVIINPGTVIGADGFGYSRNEFGSIEKFPHLGGVIIGDNVEIGSNTSIDKGTLGNTIIKEGVKIDNLVHIAHNVVIEPHCMVIANSMIGGSVKIGEMSWISPGASILNGLTIGKNVTVGMGAVVTKNIPDNETWAGNPARNTKELKLINEKIKKL